VFSLFFVTTAADIDLVFGFAGCIAGDIPIVGIYLGAQILQAPLITSLTKVSAFRTRSGCYVGHGKPSTPQNHTDISFKLIRLEKRQEKFRSGELNHSPHRL